jgi:thiol-disulfide isomerase/thioredoxin
MPSTRGAAFALVLGAAATWLGLHVGFPVRPSSAGTDTVEHPLIAAARKEPMMTMGPARQGPALSAPLASVLTAHKWLNTPPLRPEDLRGKVVLVNFWTFTCVNWLRTFPYVRAWAEKYKDRGLVVIGVHTPEFNVEKDFANVTRAAASLGVSYSVAIDNDYAIWRAFDNYAWPALYFIDADGRVRHHVLGEGHYDQSERWIQELLSEAGSAPVPGDLVTVSPKGPEVAADEEDLASPETYVGYAKARGFTSSGGIREDVPSLYPPGAMLPLNSWALAGVWTVGGEFATLNDKSGAITYRFHARDVNLVLVPSAEGRAVRFRVKNDGAPPGADHGTDVDADWFGQRAGAAPLSAGAANATGRRSHLRDRIPRSRRARLCLHVRIEQSIDSTTGAVP